jgi:CheY-like chemotaxis protein
MKRKILLIEDEASLREILVLLLSAEGYEVEPAVNGNDGLEKAKSYRPDLIISDLRMPVMDGPTMWNELKACAETEGIPIVFMSALVEQYALKHAHILHKPFSLEQLQGAIATALMGRSGATQL